MKNKTAIGLIVLALIIGSASGYYFAPGKVKKVTEYKTKKYKEYVYVDRIITKPDGTVITEKEKKEVESEEKTKKKEVVKIKTKPQWHLSASASYNSTKLSKIVYGAQIERRILGPFFIGAHVDTASTVGVVVGMEF